MSQTEDALPSDSRQTAGLLLLASVLILPVILVIVMLIMGISVVAGRALAEQVFTVILIGGLASCVTSASSTFLFIKNRKKGFDLWAVIATFFAIAVTTGLILLSIALFH